MKDEFRSSMDSKESGEYNHNNINNIVQKSSDPIVNFEFFSLLDEAVIITDDAFLIDYWNPAAEKLYGWSLEEVKGKNVGHLLLRQDNFCTDNNFQINKNWNFNGESTHFQKDGQSITIDTRLTPFKDSHGSIQGFLLINRELSQTEFGTENEPLDKNESLDQSESLDKNEFNQKSSFNLKEKLPKTNKDYVLKEELKDIISQLKQSLKFNESILSSIAIPVFYKDNNGKYIGCNSAFSEIRGVTPEQIKGKTVIEVWPSEHARIYHQKDLELLNNPSLQIYEFKIQDKNGKDIPVIFAKNVFYDENEQVAGIVGAFVDITELKQAENALRKSETQLNAIIDGNPAPQFVIDKDHNVIYWNKALEDYSKIKASEVVGTNKHWKAFYRKERPCIADLLVDKDINNLKKWYSGKYTHSKLIEGAYEATDFFPEMLDGVWLYCTAAPIQNAKGNLIGAVETLTDITERKQAEQELIQSEEKYRSVIENIQDIFYRSDAQGNLIMASPSFSEVLGYDSLDECLGKPVAETFYYKPEDRVEFLLKLQEAGSIINYEVTLKRKDGSPLIMETSSHLNYDDSGAVSGVEGILRDITLRKKAEEELKLVNVYNRGLVEAGLDPLLISDQKGKITDLNNATAIATGYSRDELINTDFSEYFTEPEKARKGFQEVFQTGLVRDYPLNIQHRNGGVTPVLYNASVYKDEFDEVVGVLATAHDVTKLKRAQRELKDSERKFRSLVENLNVGVYRNTSDNKGHFIQVNPAMVRMFGYDSAQELMEIEVLDLYSKPEERKSFLKEIEQDGSVINKELRLKKKNNDLLWTSVSSQAHYDETGNIDWIDGIIEDITQRKIAEKALQETLQQLKRSNAELEQFAYVASHDLQEPLRMVTSFLQLLQRRYEYKLDSDANEFIQFAVDGATRMQELINDLLTYSRIGRKTGNIEEVNTEDIIKQINFDSKILIEEANASITYDNLPVIRADYPQMVQVFQNLISNAIKYQDSQEPKIHISTERKEGSWVFKVEDNGIGIDPKQGDRVFRIFQRLHGRDEYEGTGIGLAIVKRIVEQHGGTIWYESTPGEGSKFYFTIPSGDDNK